MNEKVHARAVKRNQRFRYKRDPAELENELRLLGQFLQKALDEKRRIITVAFSTTYQLPNQDPMTPVIGK